MTKTKSKDRPSRGEGNDDPKAVDHAFASAKHVTKLDIVNNRLVPNAMEPRAAIGDYDPATGRYQLRKSVDRGKDQTKRQQRLALRTPFLMIQAEHDSASSELPPAFSSARCVACTSGERQANGAAEAQKRRTSGLTS